MRHFGIRGPTKAGWSRLREQSSSYWKPFLFDLRPSCLPSAVGFCLCVLHPYGTIATTNDKPLQLEYVCVYLLLLYVCFNGLQRYEVVNCCGFVLRNFTSTVERKRDAYTTPLVLFSLSFFSPFFVVVFSNNRVSHVAPFSANLLLEKLN